MSFTGSHAHVNSRRELGDQLERFVRACHDDGLGQIVRLVGEAGIGKTTVVSNLAAVARELNCNVWLAQAAELDATTPYGVIAATQSDRSLLFGAEFAATVTPGAIPNRFGPEVERFGVVERIIETVESQCQSPTLMIVEDVHWADAPSLEALAMVARVALTHPLVLL